MKRFSIPLRLLFARVDWHATHLVRNSMFSKPNKLYAQAPQVDVIASHKPIDRGWSQWVSWIQFWMPKAHHQACLPNLSYYKPLSFPRFSWVPYMRFQFTHSFVDGIVLKIYGVHNIFVTPLLAKWVPLSLIRVFGTPNLENNLFSNFTTTLASLVGNAYASAHWVR